jgi:hypothetical protein
MTQTTFTHIKKKAGWSVWENYYTAAVVPNSDSIPHIPFNPDCPCGPREEGKVLIHEAIDGRTEYEQA